jgi:hypothetical protein
MAGKGPSWATDLVKERESAVIDARFLAALYFHFDVNPLWIITGASPRFLKPGREKRLNELMQISFAAFSQLHAEWEGVRGVPPSETITQATVDDATQRTRPREPDAYDKTMATMRESLNSALERLREDTPEEGREKEEQAREEEDAEKRAHG